MGRSSQTKPPRRINEGVLKELVEDYIREHRDRAQREMEVFRKFRTLKLAFQDQLAVAIRDAVKVSPIDGKNHGHQWRQAPLLPEVESKLQAAREEIGAATDFDALYNIIEDKIRFRGIAELTIYDITHRIGAFLGLEPKRVYLHTGTAEGARALGFVDRTTLVKNELPEAFAPLAEAEIEDFLCIYKSRLAGEAWR
jgi:hypothetical protein